MELRGLRWSIGGFGLAAVVTSWHHGAQNTSEDCSGSFEVAKYQVLGRSIAGSFFVEYLLREQALIMISSIFRAGRAGGVLPRRKSAWSYPVLITPGGERIIESMAIFTHLVEAFPGWRRPGDPARDRMCASRGDGNKSLSEHAPDSSTYYYGP